MIQRICNFFMSALILALAILAGILILPRVFGYQSLAVLSGSMEPKMKVGSIVLAKETDVKDIAIGDVITYRLSEHTMVTHRVTGIDKEKKEFTTKGDANNSEDVEAVPFRNVVGKVTCCIPMIGYLSIYAKTPLGIAAICGVLAILILLIYLPEIFAEGSEADSPKKKEKVRNKNIVRMETVKENLE